MELRHIQEIEKLTGSANVSCKEPMKKHTTFRIGGEAEVFCVPESVEQVIAITDYCKKEEIPYFILGNGSNLLVSDKGFDGVVIQIFKNLNKITQEGDLITVQAGALLSSVAATAYEASLTGFEFAAGIPGTVGGAVVMNAGAYGGEMKQVIESVTVLNKAGQIEVLPKDQLEFGYRTSAILKREDVVLEAVVKLQAGDKEQIKARMDELREQRKEKQPLEFPSAGSTFKRPEGYFAGKLIMDAGLRGFQIGGARVSDKHCGFVINTGDATAADVIQLTDAIKKKIMEKDNVCLELEVKMLGEF